MASNDQFKSLVNKRLKQIEDAHKATANSTLRFGPPLETKIFTQEDLDKISNEIDDLTRCPVCKTKLPKTYKYKELCYDCQKNKEASEKEHWLLKRKEMTLEDRIAYIESWLYDHSKVDHTRTDFVMR